MAEQDPKGFKVVDKRGRADEDREKAAPAPPTEGTGNRPGGEGVGMENSPQSGPSGVGAPTFLDLVGMLQFGAMANLGMIQSSEGKRSPVNLPAAKDSIDLLGLLQEKTKGNLTPEESGILTEGLYHLRMSYVAALKAPQGQGGKRT